MALRGIAFLFDTADPQDTRAELEQALQRLGFFIVPIRNAVAADASSVAVGQIRDTVAEVEEVVSRAVSADDMNRSCNYKGGDEGAGGGENQAELEIESKLVEVDGNDKEAGNTAETAVKPEAAVLNADDGLHDAQNPGSEEEASNKANAEPEPNPIEPKTEGAEELDADVTFDKPAIVETTEEDVLKDEDQLELKQEVAETGFDPWTTEEPAEVELRETGRLNHQAVDEWVSAASMATAPEHRVASILGEPSRVSEADIRSMKLEGETPRLDTVAGDTTSVLAEQTPITRSHSRVTSSERRSRNSGARASASASTSRPKFDETVPKLNEKRVRRRKKYKYIVREELPRQVEDRPEPDIPGRKTAASAKPRATGEKKSCETRTVPGWLAAVLT